MPIVNKMRFVYVWPSGYLTTKQRPEVWYVQVCGKKIYMDDIYLDNHHIYVFCSGKNASSCRVAHR